MPRIAGVDIPDRKAIRYSLRYVHGIGPKFADDILAEAGIDPATKAMDLTDQQVSQINSLIDGNYLVEGALRRQVAQNIQRMREIRSYRGNVTVDAVVTPATGAHYEIPAPRGVIRYEEDHPAMRYNGYPPRQKPGSWSFGSTLSSTSIGAQGISQSQIS